MTRTRARQMLTSVEPYFKAGTDTASFSKLHKLAHSIIVEWEIQQEASKHKFYQQWLLHWKLIIKAIPTFPRIKDQLHLKNIAEYKEHLLQCPAIVQNIDLWLNYTGSKIQHALKPKQNLEQDNEDGIIPTYANIIQDTSTMEATFPYTTQNDPMAMATGMQAGLQSDKIKMNPSMPQKNLTLMILWYLITPKIQWITLIFQPSTPLTRHQMNQKTKQRYN